MSPDSSWTGSLDVAERCPLVGAPLAGTGSVVTAESLGDGVLLSSVSVVSPSCYDSCTAVSSSDVDPVVASLVSGSVVGSTGVVVVSSGVVAVSSTGV